jgi:putative flippase GtrA
MTKQNKEEILRVVKYTCFAASAGVIQVLTNLLFNEVFHWQAWLSYFVSLVLSVLWNFTFNRKFTFHAANNIPIAMAKVAGYYLVFTPLSLLWTYWLCDMLGVNRYLIEAATMLINFVTEFLFQQFVVFPTQKEKTPNAEVTNDLASEAVGEVASEVANEVATGVATGAVSKVVSSSASGVAGVVSSSVSDAVGSFDVAPDGIANNQLAESPATLPPELSKNK